MDLTGFKTQRKTLSYFVPYFVLMFMVLTSVVTSFYVNENNQNNREKEFQKIVNRATIAIEERFYYYENMLRQAAAFFMSSEEVSPSEFREYTKHIKLMERFPGLTAIGYAQLLKAQDVQRHIEDSKTKIDPNYKIWPFNKNAKYYAPVKYIEPFSEISRPLLGFDMLSERSRLKAMMDSAGRGAVIVTNELHLHTTPPEEDVRGFNLYAPTYTTASEPFGRDNRFDALSGFIVGIFHTNHLFNAIIKERDFFQRAISIKVILRTNGNLDEIYDSSLIIKNSQPNDLPTQHKTTTSFLMGDKEVVLKFESLPALDRSLSTNLHWYVLFSGVIFSLFIFIFLRRLHKAKTSIERSEKNLQKSVGEKSLMVEEGKILSQILDTEDLLNELANFLTTKLDMDCTIYYSEEEKFKKEINRASSSETNIVNASISQRLKDEVLKRSKTIVYNKQQEDPDVDYIGLPLILKGNLRGILILRDQKKFHSDEQNLRYLNELAYIAAVCLENSLLFCELQKSNKLKDEFLATVSHELRTPLNVIYGHSQLLIEEDFSPDIKEQIDAIYRSAKRQSIIIEDILDISSIVNRRIKFDPHPLNINESISTAIEGIELDAAKKGISIKFDASCNCSILGVKTRLIQIFWNLLSNAIKFTPESGSIHITTSQKDGKCIIKVTDTGQGISPEFLPHIFERFRQEDQTTIRSKGGLGLGLAIVSDLMKLHKGTVEVESHGENIGTTFTLSFPTVDSKLVVDSSKKQKKDDETLHHLKGIKILAIDDEPDSLRLIKIFLEPFELDLITANSAKEALIKFKSESPDLIISDIGMPEMNGYELMKEIRKSEEDKQRIPAIALTAYAQKEDKIKAIESGFDKFVTKPIKKNDLIVTIKELLN